jgi:hypothetical protein
MQTVESPARPGFSPVQWAVSAGSLVVLVYSVWGLIVNPDFAIGDAATSVKVLGVDMNGWHALSGFLIAVPSLVALRRLDWSFAVAVFAAGALVLTGVWALIDVHPFGVLYLPAAVPDALLHFGTAAIFGAGALHHYTRRATS